MNPRYTQLRLIPAFLLAVLGFAATAGILSAAEGKTPAVLKQGDRVVATTKHGTVEITATGEKERTFSWAPGKVYTVRFEQPGPAGDAYLEKRGIGISPGPDGIRLLSVGEFTNNGPTRKDIVLDLLFNGHPKGGNPDMVWTADGLVVYFNPTPTRDCMVIHVFQLRINGKKPGNIPLPKHGSVKVHRAA
ncbi:hypothetical protein DB346_19090 [Verrucomicrobia bacterium LW23]|nr:hypothetical protein DB346_19090 [Verrucomicrobia bacterium LW23]